ncbi:hypothetical protein GCM10022259_32970 [Aquimarina mytili]
MLNIRTLFITFFIEKQIRLPLQNKIFIDVKAIKWGDLEVIVVKWKNTLMKNSDIKYVMAKTCRKRYYLNP